MHGGPEDPQGGGDVAFPPVQFRAAPGPDEEGQLDGPVRAEPALAERRPEPFDAFASRVAGSGPRAGQNIEDVLVPGPRGPGRAATAHRAPSRGATRGRFLFEEEQVGQDDGRGGLDHDRHAQGDAGVVAAGGRDLGRPARLEVDRPLRRREARRRLDGDTEDERIAVGDAAVDAPGVVGLGPAVGPGDGVVGGRAGHPGQGEAGPELDAFDGRDGEQDVGQERFDGIEEGLAQSGRDPRGLAGDRGRRWSAFRPGPGRRPPRRRRGRPLRRDARRRGWEE